jgi:hypothetical protein
MWTVLAMIHEAGNNCEANDSLEKEVKIQQGVSSVVAEVGPVLRVGNVVVHLKRVVVVGDVSDGQ